MSQKENRFGYKDNSYKAAGELAGITKLVDNFYHYMDTLPQAKMIRDMHPKDLTLSKQKLSYFLSGWLGGPKLYQEHFGSIKIPLAHGHLAVTEAERDTWLLCMEKAAEDQDYSESFKRYLLEQLFIPAERIRQVCQK